MAHRVNKYSRPVRPLSYAEHQTSERKSDGLWVIRRVRPGTSTKAYRCPECDREIVSGEAHIVAWPHTPPIGSSSGLTHRRHYHSTCWQRRR